MMPLLPGSARPPPPEIVVQVGGTPEPPEVSTCPLVPSELRTTVSAAPLPSTTAYCVKGPAVWVTVPVPVSVCQLGSAPVLAPRNCPVAPLANPMRLVAVVHIGI